MLLYICGQASAVKEIRSPFVQLHPTAPLQSTMCLLPPCERLLDAHPHLHACLRDRKLLNQCSVPFTFKIPTSCTDTHLAWLACCRVRNEHELLHVRSRDAIDPPVLSTNSAVLTPFARFLNIFELVSGFADAYLKVP